MERSTRWQSFFSIYKTSSFALKYCYYALHFLDENKIINLQINDYGAYLSITQFILYKLLTIIRKLMYVDGHVFYFITYPCPNYFHLNLSTCFKERHVFFLHIFKETYIFVFWGKQWMWNGKKGVTFMFKIETEK